MQTVEEFIEKADRSIEYRKSIGKNTLVYGQEQIDYSNVEDYILKYYNSKNIAATIKRCPLQNTYEIVIWWD